MENLMNEQNRSFVPYHITICGLDELVDHSKGGITHVLSILDPHFPDPDDFGSYGELERLELRFDDIIDPAPGKILPREEHIEAILRFGRDLATTGPNARLLVHCHAGVSRSTAATIILLAQALPTSSASEIFAEVARIRPRAWPNLRLIELADAKLNRQGSLVAAAFARYNEVGRRSPGIVAFMNDVGRGRETVGLSSVRP